MCYGSVKFMLVLLQDARHDPILHTPHCTTQHAPPVRKHALLPRHPHQRVADVLVPPLLPGRQLAVGLCAVIDAWALIDG